MYSPTILKQIEKFAKNDMAMARLEEDGIIITDTKQGNVDLSYANGIYRLANASGTLYEGKAKGCCQAIVSLYDVVA